MKGPVQTLGLHQVTPHRVTKPTRNSYDAKVLAEILIAKPRPVAGQLAPGRALELQHETLAVGITKILTNVSRSRWSTSKNRRAGLLRSRGRPHKTMVYPWSTPREGLFRPEPCPRAHQCKKSKSAGETACATNASPVLSNVGQAFSLPRRLRTHFFTASHRRTG